MNPTSSSAQPSASSFFCEALKPYKTLLVDVVGVVYDGVAPYPGAIETLNTLIQDKKQVVFLSNNPRPGDLLAEKLKNFGVTEPFQVFTSGDATRLYLKDCLDKKIFHLGAARNQDILRDLPAHTVDTPGEAHLILLTAFLEENESFNSSLPLLEEIASLQKPIICANPDKIAVHGETVRQCAGTFGEKLETLGAAVLYLGKPSQDFYSLFYDTFLKKHDISLNQILMIGDTQETDIEGAHRFGIDSLLVLTGNAAQELAKSHLQPEKFVASVEKKPTYYAPSLGQLHLNRRP